jgi:peptidoglycan hydrolase-like protein with peptidoglycan-binding domain
VHFTTIVFVGGGYYYWDAGYWCPAWGYDPNYESYDYDGPIYTYGNLLPDQVILNVQHALKDLGYYAGGLSGSLSPETRRAISAYQRDYGLEVNGIVDGPTVQALGLI